MFFLLLGYTFPAVGSQTAVVEEHRGDVPFWDVDVLSGETPLTGSGSAYKFEYGRKEAAADY